jgi:hypothetical protein
MGISLKPSEASQGGGAMIDDVDVTIKAVRFRLWDYNGQIPNPILGLEVTYVDDEGNEAAQVYSAGETKHFVPSPDGSEAQKVGSIETLQETTNAMQFMVSLVNAGFPEDKIADKVTVFEGTRVHVNAVPQPKRPGIKNAKEGKTILLVSKIHSLPGEKAKAPAKAKAAPLAAAAAKVAQTQTVQAEQAAAPGGNGAATDVDLNAIGIDTLMGIIMAKGGSIPQAAIAQEAFKVLASHPQRNQIVQLVYKPEFLKQAGAPWSYDGSTVSMG